MENIIQNLVLLEKKAQAVTAKTEMDLHNLPDIISKRKTTLIQEIENQTSLEMNAMYKVIHEEITEEIKAIFLNCEKRLNAMDGEYNENCEKWENETFQNIIKS